MIIAELPAGYDEDTRIFRLFDGALCVTHPENPPMIVDLDGSIRLAVPCLRTAIGAENIFD